MFFVACSSDKDKTSETSNATEAMANAGNTDCTRGYSVHRIDGTNLYLVTENNQQCVKNDTGKVVVPNFCTINIFDQGFQVITNDMKYGAYNREGKCLVEPKFKDLTFSEKMIWVASENGSAVFNLDGKQLTSFGEYDSYDTFKEHNYFAVYSENNEMLFDYDGKQLLPEGAKEITCWNGDYDHVFYQIGEKKGMWSEKLCLNPEYDDITIKDNFIVVKKFQKQRLLSAENGKPMTDWFESLSEEHSNKDWNNIIGYVLYDENHMRGFISLDGSYYLPLEYNDIRVAADDYLQVRKDGKDYLLTMTGRKVFTAENIKCVSTYIQESDSTGHYKYDAIVTLNGKQGVYSLSQQKILIPPVYEKIELLSSCNTPNWTVVKSGKCGALTYTGATLIPAVYDGLELVSSQTKHWAVAKNGKRGVLTYTGATLIPVTHEVLGLGFFKGYKEECYIAGKAGNFSLYNLKNGKFIGKMAGELLVHWEEGSYIGLEEAKNEGWLDMNMPILMDCRN